jgi:hypothetical protein
MDKLTEDVEDKEDEDTDKDSTDDEEMFDEDDRSLVKNQSNATSVCTSLELSDQAVYPRQEYPTQLEVGTRQQMTTEEPVRPPHLASTFVDQQTNSMCQADTQFNRCFITRSHFQPEFHSTLPKTVRCANIHARHPRRHIRRLQHHCTGRRQPVGS